MIGNQEVTKILPLNMKIKNFNYENDEVKITGKSYLSGDFLNFLLKIITREQVSLLQPITLLL